MESKGFSAGAVIKESWELTKKHLGFFVPYLLVVFVLNLFSYYHKDSPMAFLVYGAVALIQLVLSLGLIKAYLRVSKGEAPSWSDGFIQLKNILTLAVVWILYSLLIFLGLFLLVVPGIYWGIKYGYALWSVIDRGSGIKEAFHHSALITEGIKWDLVSLWCLSFIITLIGALALGIGLLIAIPVIGIAYGIVYHRFAQ